MRSNSIPALVSDAYGTFIARPYSPHYKRLVTAFSLKKDPDIARRYANFMEDYEEAFPERKEPRTQREWELVRFFQESTGTPNFLSHRSARMLYNRIRQSGMGFVILSPASSEQSERVYDNFGMSVSEAYSFDMDTGSNPPSTFLSARETMRESGFEPVAYLTDDLDLVMASAISWGKGLRCGTQMKNDGYFDLKQGDEVKGRILGFNWENVPFETEKILRFLKE